MGTIKIAYRQHRDITVAGFVPDADPRVTPPDDSLLFEMQEEVGRSGDPTKAVRGHSIYFRFLDVGGADVVGASADFTAWVKDEQTGKFVRLYVQAALVDGVNRSAPDVGRLWIQVTALNAVGAATHVQVMLTEDASIT